MQQQPSYESLMVGELNLAPDSRDHGMLRHNTIRRETRFQRWDITPEKRKQYVDASSVALRMALEKQDYVGINNVIKTLVMMEGQNQKDEHHAEGDHHVHEHEHAHRVIAVKPPRVLE